MKVGRLLCAGNSRSLLLVHASKLVQLIYVHDRTHSSHISIQEPLHTSLYTERVLTYMNVQISSCLGVLVTRRLGSERMDNQIPRDAKSVRFKLGLSGNSRPKAVIS
jgi:hypothetical protein